MKRAAAAVLLCIGGLLLLALLFILSVMPAKAADPAPAEEAPQYYVVPAEDLQRIATLVRMQRAEIERLKAKLGNAKECI